MGKDNSKVTSYFKDTSLELLSGDDLEKLKAAYTFRPKKDEASEILKFLTEQSNFNDAVRYLIEKEIAENGLRDLSKHIPGVRDLNYFKGLYSQRTEPINSKQESVLSREISVAKEEAKIIENLVDEKSSINIIEESNVKSESNKNDHSTKDINKIPEDTIHEIQVNDNVATKGIEENKDKYREEQKIENIDDEIPDCYA